MMVLDRQKEIIRERQRSAPVQMVPLANDFGIKVYKMNWDRNSGLSGLIRRNPESPEEFEIYVNQNHSQQRRRFTIAHEIAHALLHPFEIGDGLQDDALLRSGLPQSIEFQANRMAADLLMPWHLLRPKLDSGATDVNWLAHEFDVSPQAMAIRLGVPQ